MIERLTPPGIPAPRGPYSPAVRAGDFIFVSGQVPVDPATNQDFERRYPARDAPGAEQHQASFWKARARRWPMWCESAFTSPMARTSRR